MALLGRHRTLKRSPTPGATLPFEEGLRVRCPLCQAQLAGVATQPASPEVELRVICRCGFEITVEGPGLTFERRGPRADQ